MSRVAPGRTAAADGGRAERWLALAVVSGLLGATAAAVVITEQLKLTPSPILGTRVSKTFSPVCGCATAGASASFRLRRGGLVEVDVIDSSGSLVRRLARRRFRAGLLSFSWFGRNQNGGQSTDGTYRIRVDLRSEHRTIVLPNLIRLDTVEPKVEQFRVSRTVIRVGERIRIAYRFSESDHPILLVDGRQAVYGRFAHSSGTLDWFGKIDSAAVAPGVHRLTFEARDDAGNVSGATTPIDVRVGAPPSSHRRRPRRNRSRGGG